MDFGSEKDEFLQCSKSGDLEKMKSLVEGGVDVLTKEKDFPKAFAIHFAAHAGKNNIIEYLVQQGCDPGITDANTPLMCACDGEQLESVKYLIEKHNVDIDAASEDGWTCLHRAVEVDNEQIVEYLVQRGADFSLKNSDGKTPHDIVKPESKLHSYFEKNKLLKEEIGRLSLHEFNELKQSPIKFQEKMEEKEIEFQKELNLNKTLFSEETQKLETQLEAREREMREMKEKGDEEIEQMKRSHNTRILDLQSTHQTKIDGMNEELEETKRNHDLEIQMMERKHETEKETLKYRYEEEMSDKIEEVNQSWERKVREKEKVIRSLSGEQTDDEFNHKKRVVTIMCLFHFLIVLLMFFNAVGNKWCGGSGSLGVPFDDFDGFLD